jgi:hypothetical protein
LYRSGAGETFPFARRPGASEVQLRVWDRDITRKEFLGCGAVELHSLPHDGSWSENIALPLFPQNTAEHTGEAMGFLVVRWGCTAVECSLPTA